MTPNSKFNYVFILVTAKTDVKQLKTLWRLKMFQYYDIKLWSQNNVVNLGKLFLDSNFKSWWRVQIIELGQIYHPCALI